MKNNYKEKRAKLLEFCENYYVNNGVPPTMRQFVELGIYSSTSTIHYALNILMKENKVRKVSGFYIPVSCVVVKNV